MSHITKIQVEINEDLDVAEKAGRRVGLQLNRNQRSFRAYASHNQCDHAFSVVGNEQAYEMGLKRRTDGKAGYELLWDSWSGGYGLVDKVGQDANLFKQAYATETAKKQMESEGFWAEETVLPNGTVELEFERREW